MTRSCARRGTDRCRRLADGRWLGVLMILQAALLFLLACVLLAT